MSLFLATPLRGRLEPGLEVRAFAEFTDFQ